MCKKTEEESSRIHEQESEMRLENIEGVEERFREMEKDNQVIKISELNK